MATKSKVKKHVFPPVTRPESGRAPWTTEERLQRIEAMGQRINGYVQFMCQVAKATSASGEATERAVLAFYEQMIITERQLGAIHDEFKLE